MKITPIKTHKILPGRENVYQILDKYIFDLQEKSILVVTSKIVAICEGRFIKIGAVRKPDLIKKEAEYYLPPETNPYNITLTIKRNLLVPTAGIDESNGAGYYILWPKDPQESANKIRNYLVKKHKLKKLGVVITDSKTSPLRWGTSGVSLAASGFSALNNYIGKPDIFGHTLRVTKSNIVDAVAVAAVVVMGEGDEQTPLAMVTEVPFIHFLSRNPTKSELEDLYIKIDEDLYGPLLKSIKWKRGKS